MEPKKNPKIALERKTGMFFNIGLAASLLLVITAFEWRFYDDGGLVDLGQVDDDFEDIMEIPPTEQPPPPPPKIELPKIIEIPDEEEIEEEIEVDLEADAGGATEELHHQNDFPDDGYAVPGGSGDEGGELGQHHVPHPLGPGQAIDLGHGIELGVEGTAPFADHGGDVGHLIEGDGDDRGGDCAARDIGDIPCAADRPVQSV